MPSEAVTETDATPFSWSKPARFPIQSQFCETGPHVVEIGIGAAAFVTAVFGCEDPAAAPLFVPLERSSDGLYRKTVMLGRKAALIEVLVEPGCNPVQIHSVTVQRLGWSQLARFGWRRAIRHIGSPMLLFKKLRAVVAAGGGDVVFSDGPASPAERDRKYRDWQRAFESPEQAQALRREIDALRGKRSLRILCVTCAQHLSRADIDASLASLRASVPADLAQVLEFEINLAQPVVPGEPSQDNAGTTASIAPGDAFKSMAQELRRVGADVLIILDRPGQWNSFVGLALLYECLWQPDCIAVYGDHDTLTPEGVRKKPFFKPDWSPEYLRSWNYVGPAVAFRGNPGFFDALPPMLAAMPTNYEVLLRLTTELSPSAAVRHIPRILFHFAPGDELFSELDLGTAAAVLPALEPGAVVEPQGPLLWRVNYKPVATNRLISAIIPSKNNPELLKKAVRSVLDAVHVQAEIIIVDNGSTLVAQQEALDSLCRDARVRTVSDPRPYNFSQLINAGAKAARGDVLLLLNDDVEATERTWLAEMAILAARPGVGCVGALLLYPNGTVQHAGVVLGINGMAAHAFRHWPPDAGDIGHRLQVTHEVSVVTGACLAVTAGCFSMVGGFAEDLPVTLNDVDFCLRVREAGYRNLVTPHACLLHRESTTSGLDTTPEKLQRLTLERDIFVRRWGTQVLGDPFYSPHLSRNTEDFSPRGI